ncbi:DNA mismatch repair protein MutS [Synechococcus sp. JJ3a-Johnson]|uniref:DNA mismatch repair protein MutS n=1 Tax=Synechococcus sp. JJ3a-Johnson TaxID=2823738 RepID=UPI0020CE19C8|nr:DNA mismatch repair protein MutS [Synechococcus sp. JJ3a-Johnson]MCP9829971.1 DNA mismatch repair protein MutS [Synechococcus sp. JJ3a-Johnson]
MAAPHEQQPELALQGSLFGLEPEPQPEPPPQELEAADLAADAAARPRQRQPRAEIATEPAASDNNEGATAADNDLPPWHHHALVEPEQLTPMLRHYVELKRAHPERVLLYRLGDFFECFFEDAIQLSRLLELTLTGKEAGKALGRVPMAGIPHHAAERYCGELVRRGISVALCDQLEEASTRGPASKGALLKRDITRVLTPGTVLEEGMLAARRNNWLCAVVLEGEGSSAGCWGLAVADVSTGEFRVTEREGSDQLHQELLQVEAAEVLWPMPESSAASPAWCPEGLRLTPLPRTPFATPEARATLLKRFRLASLDGLGLAEAPLALRAAGGLLRYLDDTQPGSAIPLELPTTWHAGDHVVLEAATRRNLELTKTQLGGTLHGSLLGTLDRTMTAMGGRCLRRWIEAPLVDIAAITARQDGVGELVGQRSLRLALRRLLRPMGDLERLAGRAGAGTASARDLVALADGLERLPQLAALLAKAESAPLACLARPWPELAELAALLRHTLLETPPLSLSEGGLIHDGVDAQLDGLRNQLDDQDTWLAQQEAAERRASGISTLKLQYHRTFGYFLAVSKAKAAAVPEHWIRRQTLANEERFITPELKGREGRILQLKARAAQREYELFCTLRSQIGKQAGPIRAAARLVAELDALASLADVAATSGYCRPEMSAGRELVIEAGRHPVVEQLLVEQPFTPNSIALGGVGATAEHHPDLIVLTGPNASGKSCYLRQTGLLQLMAQIGSWIPARSARLGIADRIFTRVGAGDDLAAGQSTFMVEMAETANILHHATEHSLVLLDEIGRGTATFDGLSIAWAVAEHLAGGDGLGIRARSVFATHYHELNELAELLPNVANRQVLVEETGNDLVFLHKVVDGGASRSYGIEAARLAGVPPAVVLRARQVLSRIEANSHVVVGLDNSLKPTQPAPIKSAAA